MPLVSDGKQEAGGEAHFGQGPSSPRCRNHLVVPFPGRTNEVRPGRDRETHPKVRSHRRSDDLRIICLDGIRGENGPGDPEDLRGAQQRSGVARIGHSREHQRGGTVEQVVKRFAPGGKDRENAGRRLEFGKFRHGPLGDEEGPGGEFVQEGGGESGAPPFREVQLLDVAAGGQGIAEQRASFNGIAAKGLAAGLCA